jgi:hypothetical protein
VNKVLFIMLFLMGCSHQVTRERNFIRISIYNYYIGCIDNNIPGLISQLTCKVKTESYLKQLENDLK